MRSTGLPTEDEQELSGMRQFFASHHKSIPNRHLEHYNLDILLICVGEKHR
jgi:hypothetical protein